jgi:hypothetical protein
LEAVRGEWVLRHPMMDIAAMEPAANSFAIVHGECPIILPVKPAA